MSRRNILAVVVCCILLSWGAQAERPVPTMERPPIPDSLHSTYLFFEGLKAKYADTTSFERADSLFREALICDSTHTPSWYQRASYALLREEYAEAERLILKAYMADSTDIWHLQLYGQALALQKKRSEALRVYEKLRELDASNPMVYTTIATLYYYMQMPYSAIQTLDSAEVHAGFWGELHLQKCALLLETGQFDRARNELVRYRTTAPYDVDAGLLLASLYEYRGEDSLQLQTLKEVLAVDPANADALTALYEIYRKANNTEEFLQTAIAAVRNKEIGFDTKSQIVQSIIEEDKLCRRYFPQVSEMTNSMITQYPHSYRAHEHYTVFLANTGMLNEGFAKMKEFFAAHPHNTNACEMVLGISLGCKEPIDSLMVYTQRYIDARPGEVEPWITQAMIVAMDSSRSEQAISIYKKAMRFTENDSIRSTIHCSIADIYNAQEENKKAYKHYERALKYNPDNAAALNNYSYQMMISGLELERCEQMALRAMTLEPNNDYYIDTYAWALFLRGKLDEALHYIKKAVSLNRDNNTTVLVHYGDILYAKGEKFMARIYWRRALEKGHNPEEIAPKLKQP